MCSAGHEVAPKAGKEALEAQATDDRVVLEEGLLTREHAPHVPTEISAHLCEGEILEPDLLSRRVTDALLRASPFRRTQVAPDGRPPPERPVSAESPML